MGGAVDGAIVLLCVVGGDVGAGASERGNKEIRQVINGCNLQIKCKSMCEQLMETCAFAISITNLGIAQVDCLQSISLSKFV